MRCYTALLSMLPCNIYLSSLAPKYRNKCNSLLMYCRGWKFDVCFHLKSNQQYQMIVMPEALTINHRQSSFVQKPEPPVFEQPDC